MALDPAEHLMGQLVDRRGRTAADWATIPLAAASQVLCLTSDGRAGTVRVGRPGGCSARADPVELPVRTNALDGLCLLLTLAGTTALDDAFAEVRRVLRPAGTLVVLTPAAAPRTPAQLPLRGVHRTGWPVRSALEGAGWLLAAADFAVLGDDRVGFSLPVADRLAAERLAAELPAAGLWPPVEPAPATVARLMASAGRRWPVPLRRLVARR